MYTTKNIFPKSQQYQALVRYKKSENPRKYWTFDTFAKMAKKHPFR